MPYANLDDGYAEHPKITGLTDAAFRLHTAAICHAARYTTDGYIAAHDVPRLVPRFRQGTLAELTRTHLWTRDENGYWLHDYLDWNRSRAQIQTDRENARKRRDAYNRRRREGRNEGEEGP